MEKISNILKEVKPKKTYKYQWQEKASEAISMLVNASNKKSSIFKCFKDNTRSADIAIRECKELNQLNVLYFLKVYNKYNKK